MAEFTRQHTLSEQKGKIFLTLFRGKLEARK